MAVKAGAIRFNTDSSQLELYDGNQWTGILSNSAESETGSGRGLFGGGWPANANRIDMIHIDSQGSAIDFGDLTTGRQENGALSSRIRAYWGADAVPSSSAQSIDVVTFGSGGNAWDFGDLTQLRQTPGGGANSIRGLFAGGYAPSPTQWVNTIDHIALAATGAA